MNRQYFAYMMREFSALFLALYSIILSFWMVQLATSEEFYLAFASLISSTPFLVLSGVMFVFSVYHSLTWFNLTAKAQTVKLGAVVIPPSFVVAGNILVWLIVSGLVALVLLG
jgi:fumarate reductase subunit C